jgi:hypothetical protein
MERLNAHLSNADRLFSWSWLLRRHGHASERAIPDQWALGAGERGRCRAALDAVCLAAFGLVRPDVEEILGDCDVSGLMVQTPRDPKGFWRIDKDKDPELRHTVLTLVAFHDLEQKIGECGGDRDKGIEAFLSQNDGEGWMLPETLRLADYGLGHDDRAKEHQPVASRLGPRFFDWQLTQSAEESWRECHVHARNLLGEAGYKGLLAEATETQGGRGPSSGPVDNAIANAGAQPQRSLFE